MKKKNILSLTVLSSLMALGGLTSLNKVSFDTVGVQAETSLNSSMPSGWNKQGENENNTISAFEDSSQGHSILLNRTASEGTLKARSGLVNVKGNTYYNVSFNSKTTDTASVQIVVVEYKDNGSTAITSKVVGKVSNATNDWVTRPGMFKTSSSTTQIVVEIEALGVGETYVSKLYINEGVEHDGTISSRTTYFEGTPANPETIISSEKAITKEVLSSTAATGYSALKLTPGRGAYLKFDDYKITGKFTLRFKYRYVGPDNGTKLSVKVDGINKAGKRVWYGDSPKAGGTPHGLWDNYEFEFSAKAGKAEPIFVIIYAGLNGESTTSSQSHYLIDDVEVIDQKGNNIVEDGGFELKENARTNTLSYFDFSTKGEANWGVENFVTIPDSAYIFDGYNESRAIHLGSHKALGAALPILPKGQYTLSYKYRSAISTTLPIRMDNFDLNGKREYTISRSISNTNNEWVSDSYSFRTYNINNEAEYADVSYLVINSQSEIDIDDLSIKDENGNEFLFAGSFDSFMAGGSYVNNTDAFKDDNGDIVFSSIRKLSMAATNDLESYVELNLASLGLNNVAAGEKINVSYEYIGGSDGVSAPFSDKNTWYLGNGNRTNEWTKRDTQLETTYAGDYNNQVLRFYGNNSTEKNVYLRNLSVTDSDGNEYFHPFANGTSILPEGAFFVNEDKEAVDEFVAAYITKQGAEDYTQVSEENRANNCLDKLNSANGALRRLTTSQKELFNTSEDYAQARAIMEMWKTASSSNASIGLFGSSSSNSSTALIITVLAISAVAISTFVLVRKKKHN